MALEWKKYDTIAVSHKYPPWGLNPAPSWWEVKGWPTGPLRLYVNTVRLQALHRAPPQLPTMSVVKLEGGPAASMKPGQKSSVRSSGIITLLARWPSDGSGRSPCWHDGLVTVWDEARLRWGHNDQSRLGHQCSETTLTGESRFHKKTPLVIEPGSLMMGSKGLTHWTRESVCECSEIVGSPQ